MLPVQSWCSFCDLFLAASHFNSCKWTTLKVWGAHSISIFNASIKSSLVSFGNECGEDFLPPTFPKISIEICDCDMMWYIYINLWCVNKDAELVFQIVFYFAETWYILCNFFVLLIMFVDFHFFVQAFLIPDILGFDKGRIWYFIHFETEHYRILNINWWSIKYNYQTLKVTTFKTDTSFECYHLILKAAKTENVHKLKFFLIFEDWNISKLDPLIGLMKNAEITFCGFW